MTRNCCCNLELGLFPTQPMLEDAVGDVQQNDEQNQQQEQHHQITIFYAGKICVSDVTELQAKSILMLANKKAEERGIRGASPPPPPPGIVQSNNHQLYNPGTGLSMKRSLQRFLQKRKNRIQQACPYNH